MAKRQPPASRPSARFLHRSGNGHLLWLPAVVSRTWCIIVIFLTIHFVPLPMNGVSIGGVRNTPQIIHTNGISFDIADIEALRHVKLLQHHFASGWTSADHYLSSLDTCELLELAAELALDGRLESGGGYILPYLFRALSTDVPTIDLLAVIRDKRLAPAFRCFVIDTLSACIKRGTSASLTNAATITQLWDTYLTIAEDTDEPTAVRRYAVLHIRPAVSQTTTCDVVKRLVLLLQSSAAPVTVRGSCLAALRRLNAAELRQILDYYVLAQASQRAGTLLPFVICTLAKTEWRNDYIAQVRDIALLTTNTAVIGSAVFALSVMHDEAAVTAMVDLMRMHGTEPMYLMAFQQNAHVIARMLRHNDLTTVQAGVIAASAGRITNLMEHTVERTPFRINTCGWQRALPVPNNPKNGITYAETAADAVYRTGGIGNGKGHAGVYAGNAHVWEIEGYAPIYDSKVVYSTWADFVDNEDYIGAFYVPGMTYSQRLSINSTCDLLSQDSDISYTMYDAVNPESDQDGDGRVDYFEISDIRCDGVVEYAYEWVGVWIWGKANPPNESGTPTHFDISNRSYTEEHNEINLVATGDPWDQLDPEIQRGDLGSSWTKLRPTTTSTTTTTRPTTTTTQPTTTTTRPTTTTTAPTTTTTRPTTTTTAPTTTTTRPTTTTTAPTTTTTRPTTTTTAPTTTTTRPTTTTTAPTTTTTRPTTTTTIPPSDSWDPGDDTANGATRITPNTSAQLHGPHTLSTSDRYDWYVISMTAGRTYYFDTIGGSGDNVGELYGGPGDTYTLLASGDDEGGNRQFAFSWMPTISQEYFLRIRTWSSGDTWSGYLSYRCSSSPAPLDVRKLTAQVNWSKYKRVPYGYGNMRFVATTATTIDDLRVLSTDMPGFLIFGTTGWSFNTWASWLEKNTAKMRVYRYVDKSIHATYIIMFALSKNGTLKTTVKARKIENIGYVCGLSDSTGSGSVNHSILQIITKSSDDDALVTQATCSCRFENKAGRNSTLMKKSH